MIINKKHRTFATKSSIYTTMEENRQISRIRHMEDLLDLVIHTTKKIENSEKTLSKIYDYYSEWNEIEREIAALEEYYHSKTWQKDFADDEAGRLPKDLKRGVLSEDGIWDAINDFKEMKEHIFTHYPKPATDTSSS